MRFNLKSLTLLGGMLACLFAAQGDLHSEWQPPVIINDPAIAGDVFQTSPVLKVNPQGNAIAIWGSTDSEFSSNSNFDNIVSSFYTRPVGWSPPQIISSLELNPSGFRLYLSQADPDIVINSSNFAVAVWEGLYNTGNFESVVLATTRDPNTGVWAPVTILSDLSRLNDIANDINVALNEAGTALAAWQVRGADDDYYTSVRFLRNGVWTPQLDFPSFPGIGGDTKPFPVINPSGDAVVIWRGRQSNPDNETIAVETYKAATDTWAPQVILDLGNSSALSQTPRAAMDPNGNAGAIWNNDGNINTSYFNGTSWGPIVTLGTTPLSVDGPEIVMDLMGNVTAKWTSTDYEILTSFRLPDGSWSPPFNISSPNFINYFDPFQSQETLAVNNAGDLIAIWEFEDSNFNQLGIASAFKPFGQPWQSPEIVLNSGDYDYRTLNIGLANCGFAVAGWYSFAVLGEPHPFVMAAVNSRPVLLDSQNATATRCCDTFVTQKICYNFLSLTTDPCVAFYNIFRDGVLIASVPNTGGTLTFTDPYGCKKNNSASYTISAVNQDGFEGGQVPFTFL